MKWKPLNLAFFRPFITYFRILPCSSSSPSLPYYFELCSIDFSSFEVKTFYSFSIDTSNYSLTTWFLNFPGDYSTGLYEVFLLSMIEDGYWWLWYYYFSFWSDKYEVSYLRQYDNSWLFSSCFCKWVMSYLIISSFYVFFWGLDGSMEILSNTLIDNFWYFWCMDDFGLKRDFLEGNLS